MIVLRIIISIILLIIYLTCLSITPKNYVNNLSNIFIKLILYVCNLAKVNIINKDIFDKYYNSNKPFIVVSNHTSLLDGIMLNGAFCRLRYLAAKNADKTIFGAKYIFDKLDCIIVKENGTVRTIQENIKDRKPNDNILVIFPDAMNPIPNGRNIAPFKTGAFASGIDILPILIKYKDYTIDPTFYWYKKENPFHAWIKILLNTKFSTKIKVLPLIKSMDNTEEFKDKVYKIMSDNLAKL
tara:strand:- start:19 stop:738 length:720 start_codon:yes stop_codon:yes gene_type:complete